MRVGVIGNTVAGLCRRRAGTRGGGVARCARLLRERRSLVQHRPPDHSHAQENPGSRAGPARRRMRIANLPMRAREQRSPVPRPRSSSNASSRRRLPQIRRGKASQLGLAGFVRTQGRASYACASRESGPIEELARDLEKVRAFARPDVAVMATVTGRFSRSGSGTRSSIRSPGAGARRAIACSLVPGLVLVRRRRGPPPRGAGEAPRSSRAQAKARAPRRRAPSHRRSVVHVRAQRRVRSHCGAHRVPRQRIIDTNRLARPNHSASAAVTVHGCARGARAHGGGGGRAQPDAPWWTCGPAPWPTRSYLDVPSSVGRPIHRARDGRWCRASAAAQRWHRGSIARMAGEAVYGRPGTVSLAGGRGLR